MGKQDELATLVYQLKECGIDVGQYLVVPEGVFFESHKPADIFAKKHDKDLVRVSGQVSGWLAKEQECLAGFLRRSQWVGTDSAVVCSSGEHLSG